MKALTNKQIRILKVLDQHLVVASWDHYDLGWLARCGYATAMTAYIPTGRLSATKIWTITDRGSAFLEEERADQ